jgi:hypothetical protein
MTLIRRISRLLLCVVLILNLHGDSLDPTNLYNQVAGRTSTLQFSYVGWMSGALWEKLRQEWSDPGDYLNEAARSAYVREYLQWVARLHTYQAQIAAVYADSKVTDPLMVTEALRVKRDSAQKEVDRRESLAETIAQSQVAAVLAAEGFDLGGQLIPPVSAKVTELPTLLVISPKNKIEISASVNLNYLSADQASQLEDQLDRALGVSALVVPLGGLSLFPSMVIETWHAPTLFEIIAHEWCHHYLYFFPLGLRYDQPETRILNESTAVLLGREVARKVIHRYYSQYPEILQQLPLDVPRSPSKTPTPAPQTPPPFDFGAEMNTTRMRVDELLAAGQVSEVDGYLAQRRILFNQNGYAIRKLNLAYFAFYGGYQGVGGGSAGGTDPTGAALARLREQKGSLRAWLETVRGITTREELLRE